jgi:hypothetical protein
VTPETSSQKIARRQGLKWQIKNCSEKICIASISVCVRSVSKKNVYNIVKRTTFYNASKDKTTVTLYAGKNY